MRISRWLLRNTPGGRFGDWVLLDRREVACGENNMYKVYFSFCGRGTDGDCEHELSRTDRGILDVSTLLRTACPKEINSSL